MNKIWLDSEAADWQEALPVGNGFLGAMVFGGTAKERLQINEDSLWSGGFMERINPDARASLAEVRRLLFAGDINDAERLASQSMYGTYPHMRHYQTMGDVWIDFFKAQGKKIVVTEGAGLPHVIFEAPVTTDYRRMLDLETATGTVSYRLDDRGYRREYFASHPASAVVCHLEALDDADLYFDVSLTRKDNRSGKGSSYCDGAEVISGNTICLYGQQGGADGIRFEMAARVVSKGGVQRRMGSHILVEGSREAIIYITARTSYRSPDPHAWCMQTLDEAEQQSYETHRERHIADYRKYYEASMLTLTDNKQLDELPTPMRLARMREGKEDIGLINTYYNFSRYLLICSSREHSLPANLQGIWNEDFEPAWGSKYTININIQMNYWMAEKTGLSALHMPLLEHLEKMYPHGEKVAEDMYGARGFCCHHNTDIWGDCAPQDNQISSTIWPMGGAWLCLHLIEHYIYSEDQKFLERYFYILKGSVQFFLDYMVKDENGNYVTGPSSSPENIYLNEKGQCGCLCMGPSMDSEILRELFTGYLRLAERMKDDTLTVEVKKYLSGLPPLRIGKYGQIQEWRRDYEETDVGHRHISQLFALYPAAQIRPDTTPRLAEAAKRTLKRRLENGGGHTGWSKAWIILFFARLRDSEKAWENLTQLLQNATLDNLFDNHPPFQIDGNFGGGCGLLEMLVQDFEDVVYLLPALPVQLSEGRMTGICLKSGCTLDLKWKEGRVTRASVCGQRNGQAAFVREDGRRDLITFRKQQKIMLYEG